MVLEPVQRLGADFDRGTARRRIIDRVGGAGGRVRVSRGQPIDRPARIIAEQAIERIAERAGVNRVEPPFSGEQRGDSLIGAYVGVTGPVVFVRRR